MENRSCKSCGIIQEIEKFPKAGIIKGITYYRYLCTPCYSSTKLGRKKDIRDWYINHKKSLSCTNCGNNDYRVIEFHHLYDKEFSLSSALQRAFSIEKMKAEMKKCIPLCANCHRIEHYNENIV